MPAIINTYNTELTQRVIDTIKTCYDPEIPVDIWELGLIYEINIDEENNVIFSVWPMYILFYKHKTRLK